MAAPACGEQQYRAWARNEVSVSFNRRRSCGERVGGDYGRLRKDYSARTFTRGRPHPRDLGALSGPPARIYFRSKRHHELVLVVGVAYSELPPRHAGHAFQPSQCAVDVPQYGLARFRTSDSSRRDGVENSYLLSAWLIASCRRGTQATRSSPRSAPSTCRSTAWPVFFKPVARRIENSYSF